MKQIQTVLKSLSVIALLTLAMGCASTKTKENTLVTAGFKIIIPNTPAQAAKLQALPTGKVTMIQNEGKTYYVFPDKAHKQAYVGGPKQLQAYRALCAEQKVANENLEAAEVNQDPALGWGGWSGWDGLGGLGWSISRATRPFDRELRGLSPPRRPANSPAKQTSSLEP